MRKILAAVFIFTGVRMLLVLTLVFELTERSSLVWHNSLGEYSLGIVRA